MKIRTDKSNESIHLELSMPTYVNREEMVPYRKCSKFFYCNFNCDVLLWRPYKLRNGTERLIFLAVETYL